MAENEEPRVVAFDTETIPIGPGAIAPPIICVSYAYREDGEIQTFLTANGDACLEDDLRDLLAPGHILVGLNSAYDLGVIAQSFPDLETLIWAKLAAGEIDDVMIREMLLNLSTCGQLESMVLADGSSQQLRYNMATLLLKYTGEDISEDKDDPESVRMTYNTMDGLPAAHYQDKYRDYALDDGRHTLEIYEGQEEEIESVDDYASCATSPFHAAAHYALFCATIEGMATDPEEVARIRKWLDEELSDKKMKPLVEAGILVPACGGKPYKGSLGKAHDIASDLGLVDWDDLAAGGEGVDWNEPELRERLEAEGIKYTKPQKPKVRVKDKLRPYFEKVAERVGYQLKTTETGMISTDSETYTDLAPFDETIAAYAHREGLKKLVTTDLPAMEWPKGSGELAPVVHFPFNILVRTTRTSSRQSKRYPSRNGQQVHPKIRGCFVPRPGYVLCSVDYNSLELVCTGEVTYNLFGKSVHRDKINDGYDMHAFLGAQLAYVLDVGFRNWCEDLGVNGRESDDVYGAFMLLKTENPKFFKHWRKMAKPFGLGYPGGLGPFKMLGLAKNSYDVNIVEIAEARALEHPEEFEEPSRAALYYSNKLYGRKEPEFEWNPVLRGVHLAGFIRNEIWHKTYPEMRRYFDHVQNDCHDPNNPDLGFSDSGEIAHDGFCYTTMGMHRAACSFTACANGKAMQSPAAWGAKRAVFDVTRACRDRSHKSILYGSRVVDFVHDEIVAELLDEGPDSLHDRAIEIQRKMETAMTEVIKSTKVGTEAALMERWSKEAEPTFDEDGRLTIWRPGA